MIIPSILTDDLEVAQSKLDNYASLKPAPKVVHIDIIDGYYADNLTIDPNSISGLDRHNLSLDIHLMTVEPTDFATELVEIDGVNAVIAQVERLSDQHGYVDFIKSNNWRVGLSLNLYTPLEAIEADLWTKLDVVQIMSGQAGAQGQVFHPSTLDTIVQTKTLRQAKGATFQIMVDIGMNPQTITQAQQAGADDFVVGSYLNQDTAVNWKKLQEVLL